MTKDRLDITMAELKTEINYIKENQLKTDSKIDKIFEAIERTNEKIENRSKEERKYIEDQVKDLRHESDKKYSPRWVRDIIVGGISLVGTVIVGAILNTILKK